MLKRPSEELPLEEAEVNSTAVSSTALGVICPHQSRGNCLQATTCSLTT